MIEGQLGHLLGRRLDEPRLAEADRDAPKARKTFDIFLALVVEDINAFAALDHHRADLFVPARVGGGVKVISDVAGGERIGSVVQGRLLGRGPHLRPLGPLCPEGSEPGKSPAEIQPTSQASQPLRRTTGISAATASSPNTWPAPFMMR